MRRASWLPILAIVVLGTACGGDESNEVIEPTEEPASEPDEAETSDEAEASEESGEPEQAEGDDVDDGEEAADDEASGDADLSVAGSEFGDILVDGAGMTLYLFTNDSDGQSVCEDGCAAAWPPLVVDAAPVAGEGVDASLLDTTERSDGSTQVTYAGWPLYTWASDQQPGDVTGQGVQDVWFVVSPTGEPVTEAPEPEAVTDDVRDDGY